MANYEDALKGADLRSIGKSNLIAGNIHDQRSFDTLFDLLFHADRKVAMRAADAIEKITITNPSFIKQHKKKLLALFDNDNEIEMKWHLAQIIPRLELTKNERLKVWNILFAWAKDKNGSRIVRTNAIQSLHALLPYLKENNHQFMQLISSVYQENIPSINARIRKLRIS